MFSQNYQTCPITQAALAFVSYKKVSFFRELRDLHFNEELILTINRKFSVISLRSVDILHTLE